MVDSFEFLDTRDCPQLRKFLRTNEWQAFIDQLGNLVGYDKLNYGNRYLCMRSAVNNLIKDFHCTSDAAIDLHVMEDCYYDEAEVEVLRKLLAVIKQNHDWRKHVVLPDQNLYEQR